MQLVNIENGFSFPSGHSTIAVAFYGFIAYFLLRNMRNKKKKVAIILFTSVFGVNAQLIASLILFT